jgi:predicted GNAT family N-acyltransferase
VRPEADRDGRDHEATHLVAVEDGQVVGTCRIVYQGDIARLGRMAVEQDLRGRGVGAAILAQAEREALAAGARRISLHAQLSARSLYQRGGYLEAGPEFVEEGIGHVTMEKRLA